MKISNWSARKTGSYCTGIALIFAIVGAGSTTAETYRQGGSTATIQQSGGSGKSESRVTRYKDGQKIVTRDGRSTDITIQREKRLSPSDISKEYPTTGIGRFERWFSWERFPSIDPDEPGDNAADYSEGRLSAHDAFKQRMLDRMRGH